MHGTNLSLSHRSYHRWFHTWVKLKNPAHWEGVSRRYWTGGFQIIKSVWEPEDLG